MADPAPPDPSDLTLQDEVLQVMFWLRGEALAPDVVVGDVVRFSGGDEDAIAVASVPPALLDRVTRRL